MNRRIRFGLIFVGPRPAVDGGFLRDLGIRHIEGCSLKNRHYVLFTLKRARRSRDILNAVEAQNRLNGRGAQTDLEEELMLASDGLLIDGASTIVLVPVNGMTKKDGDGGEGGTSALPAASDQSSVFVAVFDKGHAFQSHEIFRVIYTAKLVSAQVQAPPVIDEFGAPMALPFIGLDGDSSNLPSDYWDWTAAGAPESAASGSGRGGKRVVYELSTDLVEASVKSSSSKRVSLTLQGKGVVPLVDMENELFGISSGGEEISEVVRRAVGEGEAGVAGFSNVTRLDNAPAPVPVVCNLDASVVRMPSPTVGGLDEVAADDEAVFEAQVGFACCILSYSFDVFSRAPFPDSV